MCGRDALMITDCSRNTETMNSTSEGFKVPLSHMYIYIHTVQHEICKLYSQNTMIIIRSQITLQTRGFSIAFRFDNYVKYAKIRITRGN